jgi:hypothetical protein
MKSTEKPLFLASLLLGVTIVGHLLIFGVKPMSVFGQDIPTLAGVNTAPSSYPLQKQDDVAGKNSTPSTNSNASSTESETDQQTPAEKVVASQLCDAITTRAKITWNLLILGRIKERQPSTTNPGTSVFDAFKSLLYYTVLCPDEGLSEFKPDVLTNLQNEAGYLKYNGLNYKAYTEEGLKALQLRRWLVQTVFDNPYTQKMLVHEIVECTMCATPEGTRERRKHLLLLIKDAQYYLSHFDKEAEEKWYKECLDATAKASSEDSFSQALGSHDHVRLTSYRFNLFSPGTYTPGAVADPKRMWQTFIYRRLTNDSLTVVQLETLLILLQDELYSAKE